MNRTVRERTQLYIPLWGRLCSFYLLFGTIILISAHLVGFLLTVKGHPPQSPSESVMSAYIAYLGENRNFFLHLLTINIAAALLMAHLSYRFLSRPLEALILRVKEITAGRWGTQLAEPQRGQLAVLTREINTLSRQMEERIRETEQSYAALELMNRLNKTLLVSQTPKEMVELLMQSISEMVPEDRHLLLVDHPEKEGMEFFASMRGRPVKLHDPFFLPLSRFPANQGKKCVYFQQRINELSSDSLAFVRSLPIPDLDFSKVESFINIPLRTSREYVGSLIIICSRWKEDYLSALETFNLKMDQTGVVIQRLKAMTTQAELHNGILTALNRAVDAKSRWTAGHSARVTEYSEQIARRLQLDPKSREELRTAALLHDIGKIGVPEVVLDKPGPLTDQEFAHIRNHPVLGGEMLRDLPAYTLIRRGVLYHHERWDGSGYPEGIKGGDIPSMPGSWPSPIPSTPSPAAAPTGRPSPGRRPGSIFRPRGDGSSIPT